MKNNEITNVSVLLYIQKKIQERKIMQWEFWQREFLKLLFLQ